MKIFRNTMSVFIVIIMLLFISACENTVVDNASELTSSAWAHEFENKNEIKLSFSGDYATLTLSDCNNKKVEISGFCEISKDIFVIHDVQTHEQFAFEYTVMFDCVDIVYKENMVTLYKI